jgi:hypothetical protein
MGSAVSTPLPLLPYDNSASIEKSIDMRKRWGGSGTWGKRTRMGKKGKNVSNTLTSPTAVNGNATITGTDKGKIV